MLTLRRPDEKDEAQGEEVTPIAEILAGRSKQASDPVVGSTRPGPSFLDTIKGANGLPLNSGGGPQGGTSAPVEAVWKMVVMTPAERKQYEWTDLKQLPTEVSAGSPGSPAAVSSFTPSQPTRGPEALENPDKPGVINAPAAPDDSPPPTGKSGTAKDK